MTIIVVEGLPPKWNVKITARQLSRAINGMFNVLVIRRLNKNRKTFIKLSDLLNPQEVVENINRQTFSSTKHNAYIPNAITDMPHNLAGNILSGKQHRILDIFSESTYGEVLYAAHTELLEELQMKYSGLYDLSNKDGHVLLDNISKMLYDRLRLIMVKSKKVNSAFTLTIAYRKVHPHINDFHMIASTLKNIEEATGEQQTHLDKKELMALNLLPNITKIVPSSRMLSPQYINNITNMIVNHVNNLDTEPIPNPTDEQAATLKVREELKKILPSYPMIILDSIRTSIATDKYLTVRIYGEPYVPRKKTMSSFLQQFQIYKLFRSDRIHTLYRCTVPINTIEAILAADGTTLFGATLFIRIFHKISKKKVYKVPTFLKKDMLSFKSPINHYMETED